MKDAQISPSAGRKWAVRLCGLVLIGALSYGVWMYITPFVMARMYPVPVVSPTNALQTAAPTVAGVPSPPPAVAFSARPTPEPTPEYVPFTVAPGPGTLPQDMRIQYDIFERGKAVAAYTRATPLAFGPADTYTQVKGVLTFRGNHFRDGGAYGKLPAAPRALQIVWQLGIGGIDKWTGVGWNGQSALVQWPEEIRQMMNLYPEKKAKDGLIEVIYATLDGKIYFLDLEDGTATRPPIDIGFPIKGSVSVDPRGYPLLYAGQGIAVNSGRSGNMGYRIISLIDQSVLYFFTGYDPLANRYWGACDSVPIVDGETDTFVAAMENGLFVTFDLNTVFDREAGTISVDPVVQTYRYKTTYSPTLGIENSPAMYGPYAFFIDNSGMLTCLDTTTMSPVWNAFCTDDSDASIVIEETAEGVFLYTGCEVDKQGDGGYSYLRKFNAMTGALLWEAAVPCRYVASLNGGLLATPVLGKGDLQGLIIYTVSMPTYAGGVMLALDTQTGAVVWEKRMNQYAWSSAVAVYTEAGEGYLVQCDASGVVHLLNGRTGDTIATLQLNGNVEGTPAIFDDMLVVGTRGQRIYGIRIEG